MRTTTIGLVAGTLALVGCSSLQSGSAVNEAIKWGSRGIALAQCVGEAVQTPTPEVATQQCVVTLIPELPAGAGPASAAAADLAACVHTVWQDTAAVTPETARQDKRAKGAGKCASKYGPPLFEAVRDAVGG